MAARAAACSSSMRRAITTDNAHGSASDPCGISSPAFIDNAGSPDTLPQLGRLPAARDEIGEALEPRRAGEEESSPSSEVGHNGAMSFDRTLHESALFRICFVCTGNICRSPMAEVVFRHLVARQGYESAISVMSAGTGDWHVGEHADDRTVTALNARGYASGDHRARQFDPDWFDSLDLVVVFDRSQDRILKAWAASEADRGKVQMFLLFDKDQAPRVDVPDPYYADAAMFDSVLDMIERASSALLDQIKPGIRLETP